MKKTIQSCCHTMVWSGINNAGKWRNQSSSNFSPQIHQRQMLGRLNRALYQEHSLVVPNPLSYSLLSVLHIQNTTSPRSRHMIYLVWTLCTSPQRRGMASIMSLSVKETKQIWLSPKTKLNCTFVIVTMVKQGVGLKCNADKCHSVIK